MGFGLRATIGKSESIESWIKELLVLIFAWDLLTIKKKKKLSLDCPMVYSRDFK